MSDSQRIDLMGERTELQFKESFTDLKIIANSAVIKAHMVINIIKDIPQLIVHVSAGCRIFLWTAEKSLWNEGRMRSNASRL